MSSDAEEADVEIESTTSQSRITPTDRIKELNTIDTDISTVLATASRAISLLANTNTSHTTTNPSLQSAQDAFNEESKKYFASIASIDVRLRRQVHALEEAGLIPAGSRVDRGLATAMTEDPGGRTRGGGGALDSSWLNARARNTIGRGLKEEALRDGKEFLKRNGIVVGEQVQGDREMEIDVEKEDGDEDEDMFGEDDT